MRKWMSVVPGIAFLAVALFAHAASPVKQKDTEEEWRKKTQDDLHATFRNLTFEDVRPSEIPGIVEIYSGPRIIYYAPEQKIMIFGEFYNSAGNSLTDAKQQQFVERKTHTVDRTNALTVGDGEVEVVAFVDPDCPHCRDAYRWFRQKHFSNVKQEIFFASTDRRPNAKARALNAICAPKEKKEEMLAQVFEGADKVAPDVETGCEGGEERLAAQARVAKDIGVYATPMFLVKGQVIVGFNATRLESLITGKD